MRGWIPKPEGRLRRLPRYCRAETNAGGDPLVCRSAVSRKADIFVHHGHRFRSVYTRAFELHKGRRADALELLGQHVRILADAFKNAVRRAFQLSECRGCQRIQCFLICRRLYGSPAQRCHRVKCLFSASGNHLPHGNRLRVDKAAQLKDGAFAFANALLVFLGIQPDLGYKCE